MSAAKEFSHLESSPCLQGERVAFTGILASMTHAQAAELVEQNGGIFTEHVSRKTTMLVVGEEGWPLEDNGQPSVKLLQADRWRQAGCELQILNESQWLELLELSTQRDEIHRLYTPAMLASILGVSVHVIRGWARVGLIRPVRKLYRLMYFDFREVSSARRLSELLESGIPRDEIESSLRKLPSVQRGDERPLEQLQILAHNAGVVLRDQHGLLLPGTGQRLLNFDREETQQESSEPEENDYEPILFAKIRDEDPVPRDWLVEGCRLYDAGDVREALEAFRLAAMSSPSGADVHFQLGECLYRLGELRAALERYYVAVEQDHDFLEAWTQIGCLHRELNDLESARTAFKVALDILPEYPDAHFHLAETEWEMDESRSAQTHWQEYLKHDSRGPWADIARQRLEQLTSV